VILNVFNAGRFALYFPISVVEGMLMAIGMLIIVKQIPAFLGVITPDNGKDERRDLCIS